MAKMRAVDAAMYVLEKEGITTAFGVPGAAINPFYSAKRCSSSLASALITPPPATMTGRSA